MSLQIASPRPKPDDFVVWNGWNSFVRISGAIPGPLSVTVISTAFGMLRVAILIQRSRGISSVALIALKQRLRTTCFAADGSVSTLSGQALNSVMILTLLSSASPSAS